MTALPAASDFTGPSQTEGQAKTAYDSQRAYLAGLFGEDGTPATALAALGALGGGWLNKTAAYTVTTSDRGRVINASGTWTLGLPAAATAGAGFTLVLRVASDTVTIDPSGAELIDGAATASVPANRGRLIICTGTAWVTLAMPQMQSSATDTTANLGMAVGAFGLGRLSGLAITDFTVELATGIYSYSESTATGAPGTGASFYGTAIVARGSAGGTIILATRQVATAGSANHRSWIGIRSGATGALVWSELYSTARVVGTVSMSGGVPDNAVIERGSNANGEYVRFADGTQICTKTLTGLGPISTADGSGFSSASIAVGAFAAVFSSAPNCMFSSQGVGAAKSFVQGGGSPSTTGASTVFLSRFTSSAATDFTLQCTFVGRWV